MEAEKRISEEVVKSGPRAIPVVSKFGMGAVTGDAEFLPLGDVRFGYVLLGVSVDVKVMTRIRRACLEIFGVCIIAYDHRELAHRVDADDAFKCKIGLQAERASKVVGGYWWVLAYASLMLQHTYID